MEEVYTQAVKLAEAFIKSKRKYYNLIYNDGTPKAISIIVKKKRKGD